MKRYQVRTTQCYSRWTWELWDERGELKYDEDTMVQYMYEADAIQAAKKAALSLGEHGTVNVHTIEVGQSCTS